MIGGKVRYENKYKFDYTDECFAYIPEDKNWDKIASLSEKKAMV